MSFGIPPLLGQIANVTNTISLLSSDVTALFKPNSFKWGIYIAGSNTPAVLPDNIVSMGYKKSYNVPDYPTELGSFANYNKVAHPFNVDIRMSVGTSNAARANFLSQLNDLVASTDLYDIATPEKIYTNANVVDFDYSRSSTNGAGMIIADLKIQEIRLTATTSFNNTQSPSDYDAEDVGQLNSEVADSVTNSDVSETLMTVPDVGINE